MEYRTVRIERPRLADIPLVLHSDGNSGRSMYRRYKHIWTLQTGQLVQTDRIVPYILNTKRQMLVQFRNVGPLEAWMLY